MGMSGITGRLVDSKHDSSIADVSGQTAPAAFSLLSLPRNIAAQLWPSSAPEVITVEPLDPSGSNATSYAEVYCYHNE